MKVIIAGGRDYKFTDRDKLYLDLHHHLIDEVVSGGASGADEQGEEWARSKNIPVKIFPADWKTHGRAAGPIRNREMAWYADALIAFPGGRGTENMIKTATKLGLQVSIFNEIPE